MLAKALVSAASFRGHRPVVGASTGSCCALARATHRAHFALLSASATIAGSWNSLLVLSSHVAHALAAVSDLVSSGSVSCL